MKKLMLAVALACTSSTFVHAETGIPVINVIGSNSDPATSLCLAAAESRSALAEAKATSELDLQEIRTVKCNGKPLVAFTAYMASLREKASVPVVMAPADDTSLTSLCIAAAISDEALEEVSKEEMLSADEVMCNNKPLNRFAAQYERRTVTSAF